MRNCGKKHFINKKTIFVILTIAFIFSSAAAIRYKYLYDRACNDAEETIITCVIEVKAHSQRTCEIGEMYNITYIGGRCTVAVNNLLSYGNALNIEWEYLFRLFRGYNDLMILAEKNGYNDQVKKKLTALLPYLEVIEVKDSYEKNELKEIVASLNEKVNENSREFWDILEDRE